MDKWAEFYESRVNDYGYIKYFKKKYEPFLRLLHQKAIRGSKVAEFGCGIGTVTKILHELNPMLTHTLYDNSYDVIRLAHENLIGVRDVFITNLDIIQPNFIQLFDVIHSHGVLEHFKDKDIQRIIMHQLRMSDTLIHYVPSNKYKTPSFGDERLKSPEYWMNVCRPDKVVEFNDGYDLILIWEPT